MAATPDLIMKRHDTYPPLQAVLDDQDGPIDLTNATGVLIIMKGMTTLVTGACTILDAPNGVVQYQWAAGDLAVTDIYSVEFQITWTGGAKETVPNIGYNIVQVVDDLDNA